MFFIREQGCRSDLGYHWTWWNSSAGAVEGLHVHLRRSSGRISPRWNDRQVSFRLVLTRLMLALGLMYYILVKTSLSKADVLCIVSLKHFCTGCQHSFSSTGQSVVIWKIALIRVCHSIWTWLCRVWLYIICSYFAKFLATRSMPGRFRIDWIKKIFFQNWSRLSGHLEREERPSLARHQCGKVEKHSRRNFQDLGRTFVSAQRHSHADGNLIFVMKISVKITREMGLNIFVTITVFITFSTVKQIMGDGR